MNEKPVISNEDDIPAATIISNFPNSTDAFEVTYYDDFSDFNDFYYKAFDVRNDKPLYPYRYGSYQIYQANKKNHTYSITNFLNITSQDVGALYP